VVAVDVVRAVLIVLLMLLFSEVVLQFMIGGVLGAIVRIESWMMGFW